MKGEEPKHQRWLLEVQQNLTLKTNPNITTSIFNDSDGQIKLLISNISDIDIKLIKFITNTDINNSYLYCENFSVHIEGQNDSLFYPGLKEIAIKMFNDADTKAFLVNQKTYTPFSNGAFTDPAMDINEFIDNVTAMVECMPKTKNLRKSYSIIMNPDKIKKINWKKVGKVAKDVAVGAGKGAVTGAINGAIGGLIVGGIPGMVGGAVIGAGVGATAGGIEGGTGKDMGDVAGMAASRIDNPIASGLVRGAITGSTSFTPVTDAALGAGFGAISGASGNKEIGDLGGAATSGL
jgi:hypothetical protein